MGTILLILVGIILLGVIGWILKLFYWIVEFLLEGIFDGCGGCLIIIFLILIVIFGCL